MAEVRIRDLRKSYGAAEVIHGVGFDISDGEFVVLVGPSGCGKSTLLRMIAGLEGISGGTISIGERVVNSLPPSQRDIAMVFQNYALYPHKTVGANMAFALRMRGMAKSEIQDRVRRAAEILGLTEYLGRYPRALSGGQRQRVAMGRAIVRDPQVFLFDEPLSNLDAKLRVQMRTEIRELHQRLQTTTVYVTHDQIEAMTMADRIVVMQGGHIEQIGSPLELYDRPENTFVAEFIGSPSMNMLDAVLCREDGALVADLGETRMPVADGPGREDGRAVVYGVRPEHLQPAGDGLPGEVAVVEPTGSETHLAVRAAGTELVSVLRERGEFRAGDPIRLTAAPEIVHLFDRETGQRLD
ncbi:sn-glycerol-3-phosphate ABC transporter ATP-binding protein UgpC [Psychromarinibacter sp. C21-152]|uniref:Sn-glycerol-3-phosphate ABC transporter ATP-binding protein UgpC n=1 Tax=Psychromarinibacter sediminicola TaxID=3033385 RepID=A0AAE3NXE1_9RHOB|nr:sn-glycerol-3-phosphate ABC transporter ATP-binding protein UgpC [Psychromarinibacter sediminicola]MDF0603851.1 sn-glycerol-3-phosphate ABC transporter ATP-binding protein UgpC [Psychromarinibacter sediminicola]